MTKIDLPYLHRMTDRHGHERIYYRRHGKRVALPGAPGSPEFMEAYRAAAAGTPPPTGASRVAGGTMHALIVAYYTSAGFRQLRPTTQATYRGILERFRVEYGPYPFALLEATHIRDLIRERMDTPSAANNLFRLLRILCRFAVEEGWRKDDPSHGVRPIKARKTGFHTWTEDEIATYEARWPVGTRERLALALMLCTAQRRGDVIRMGRQHVRGDAISVVQQKTGTPLTLPLVPALREALAAHPSTHLTFLVTRDGAPFTAAGFGNWFREACDKAGLPKVCAAHGLRKAAATRLADAGCTAHQIMAVTGHKTLKEVQRYTEASNQKTLAGDALRAAGRRRTNEA